MRMTEEDKAKYEEFKHSNAYYEMDAWTTAEMDHWNKKFFDLGWWKGFGQGLLIYGFLLLILSFLIGRG